MTEYNYVRRKNDGLYLASDGGYTYEKNEAFVFTEVTSFMDLVNNAHDYEIVPLTDEEVAQSFRRTT